MGRHMSRIPSPPGTVPVLSLQRAFERILVGAVLSFALLSDSHVRAAAPAPSEETTSVRGQINIPQQFEVTKEIMANTRLTLSNHIETKVAHPDNKGRFGFHNVFIGSTYILDLHHPVLHFDSITLDTKIKAGTDSEVNISPYLRDLLYGKGVRLKYPLALAPSGFKMYFEEREEFSILTILKSPMVLMMIFMFGMVYMMPKLSPEIDETQMRELRRDLKHDSSMTGNLMKKMVGVEDEVDADAGVADEGSSAAPAPRASQSSSASNASTASARRKKSSN